MNVVLGTACTPTDDRQRHAHQPGEGIKYLRSVFGESPEGICIVDAASRVVVWNRAATAMTGYEALEIPGCRCALEGTTLKLGPFGQAKPSFAQRSEKEYRHRSAICIKQKSRDGTWLHISLSQVIPLRHKDIAFFALISRNSRFPSHAMNRLDFSMTPPSTLRSTGIAHTIRPEALTPREREVLALLAAGKTAKPIAVELSLSIPTVRTHIQNLLRKLEVHSCLEAVTCYLRMTEGRS